MAFGKLAKLPIQPLLGAERMPLNFHKQMVHSENFFEQSQVLIGSGKIPGY